LIQLLTVNIRPKLLLLLGVDEGGRLVDTLLAQARRAARDEEASTPRLEPPATMWTSHCVTSAPVWGSGAGMGRFTHWSHAGGGASSSRISTAIARELPARAGSCCVTPYIPLFAFN
jgi:hypothetical protein